MPSRRSDSRNRQSQPADAIAIVRSLNSETVELEGRKISKREAHLTLLYMRSIKGEISASVELQRIRERSGANVPQEAVGCLVVPGMLELEEFTKLALEQQAQFRERNYGSDAS